MENRFIFISWTRRSKLDWGGEEEEDYYPFIHSLLSLIPSHLASSICIIRTFEQSFFALRSIDRTNERTFESRAFIITILVPNKTLERVFPPLFTGSTLGDVFLLLMGKKSQKTLTRFAGWFAWEKDSKWRKNFLANFIAFLVSNPYSSASSSHKKSNLTVWLSNIVWQYMLYLLCPV